MPDRDSMAESALERSMRLGEELEDERLNQLEAKWPPPAEEDE